MGDVVGVVQSYILKAIEEAGPGMKVMLLDSETTPILSLAFAQSALMRQEVFLFERLQNQPSQEDMRHLKCIAILRPDSVTNIGEEFLTEKSNPGEFETTGSRNWTAAIWELPHLPHQLAAKGLRETVGRGGYAGGGEGD